MIASLVASTLHHALTDRPQPVTNPGSGAPSSRTAPPVGGGSIANDLGHLTADTLSLLGLGDSGKVSGEQAAKAYSGNCKG